MFKVGLAQELLHTRYSPTALVRANYLTAVATRLDRVALLSLACLAAATV